MQHKKFAMIVIASVMFAGCSKAPEERIPFAEGKSLVCPDKTQKAEDLNSSYPEYYCVGLEGKTGTWMEFDVNGRLRTRTTYLRDRMNGEWLHYHPDGSLEMKGQMKDDMRTGEWTQYFINGKTRSIKNYAENHLSGPLKLYYQTGELMAEGTYKDDLEEGPWKVYTPEGKLARECTMVHGEETNCVIHLKDFMPSTYMYNSKENGPL